MESKTVAPAGVTGVTKSTSKSAIRLRRIYKSTYQKEDTLTAELEQVLSAVTFYPSKKTSSSMQANVFTNEEFGFKPQEFPSKETRIGWLDVPDNTTEDIMDNRLTEINKKGAVLYKVLSNDIILDEYQENSIERGLRTKDDFAKTQIVRYPENHDTKPNQIIKDKANNVQYKRIFFWDSPKEDIDLRYGKSEVYVPAEIRAELKGADVLQGQTI